MPSSRASPTGPALKAAAPAIAEAILAEHRRAFPRWLELLGPAAEALVPPLARDLRRPRPRRRRQTAAAEVLAELFARGRRDLALARIITEATPAAFRVLLRESAGRGLSPEALDFLRAVLDEVAEGPRAGEGPTTDGPSGQAGDARPPPRSPWPSLGEPEPLWPLLRHRPDPRSARC